MVKDLTVPVSRLASWRQGLKLVLVLSELNADIDMSIGIHRT
jgi:hypothetical protein